MRFSSLRGPCFRGAVSATSTGHPAASLALMVCGFMPTSRAQSINTIVRPNASRRTVLRRLTDCSRTVAHRQFSGEYGPLLSLRSMECAGEGRGPMSTRKCAKVLHRSHTVIPRPPYRKYPGLEGLPHRCFMPSQTLNSGSEAIGVRPDLRLAYCWQPQEVVFPVRRLLRLTMEVLPQSHEQSHIDLLYGESSALLTATKKPYRFPETSMRLVIGGNHGS